MVLLICRRRRQQRPVIVGIVFHWRFALWRLGTRVFSVCFGLVVVLGVVWIVLKRIVVAVCREVFVVDIVIRVSRRPITTTLLAI